MSRSDREAARVAHEVTARAIRRLDILEWVILAGAAGFALAGGAALAWLVYEPMGVGFRAAWAVASLLLFIVPGLITLVRVRKEERERRRVVEAHREEEDG